MFEAFKRSQNSLLAYRSALKTSLPTPSKGIEALYPLGNALNTRLGGKRWELISVVAILHDIGAIDAQCKYGSMDAIYQEKEGPAVARRIIH